MSDTKKENVKVVNNTTETSNTEVPKNEIKEDPILTLKESELNQRLQIAYDRGRVEMLAAIKSDITKYFDDTLLSYIPH
jgi:hypothetical protein